MEYGEALSILLEAKDMTKADLARSIGRSRSYVSQLVNGKVKEPTITLAFAISDALGVRLEDFRRLMSEGSRRR